MPLLTDIRNALGFVRRGEFGELLFRLKVHFTGIDLGYASVRELGLSPERSHDYRHSGGVALEKVLDSLGITDQDGIVDFGSGKGGALITFAKYPFARITGVELMAELIATARRNLVILGIGKVDMVQSDAAKFRELECYNYFYFYSPFPEPVMKAVLDNIRGSLEKRPRRVHLIYCNPEFHQAVVAAPPFCKSGEWFHAQLRLPIYVYCNEPSPDSPAGLQDAARHEDPLPERR